MKAIHHVLLPLYTPKVMNSIRICEYNHRCIRICEYTKDFLMCNYQLRFGIRICECLLPLVFSVVQSHMLECSSSEMVLGFTLFCSRVDDTVTCELVFPGCLPKASKSFTATTRSSCSYAFRGHFLFSVAVIPAKWANVFVLPRKIPPNARFARFLALLFAYANILALFCPFLGLQLGPV